MTTVPRCLTFFPTIFTKATNKDMLICVKLNEKLVKLSGKNVNHRGTIVISSGSSVKSCGSIVKKHENYCEMRWEKV